jgi:hypothetical protein
VTEKECHTTCGGQQTVVSTKHYTVQQKYKLNTTIDQKVIDIYKKHFETESQIFCKIFEAKSNQKNFHNLWKKTHFIAANSLLLGAFLLPGIWKKGSLSTTFNHIP